MDRKSLRDAETAVWQRLLDSMMAQYWVVFALRLVATIGGALVAVIGGGMEGPMIGGSGPTPKGWSILLGAGAAALSGLILLLAEREKPNLIADVRVKLAALREFIDLRDDMVQREIWRADCDAAAKTMMEAVENILIDSSGDLAIDIQTVLDVAVPLQLYALGIEFDEDFTYSVFKRDGRRRKMVRIAEVWFNDADAVHDNRLWAKGQGFTGQAWAAGRPIGVPDANDLVARQIYAQSPEDYPAELMHLGIRPDEERYRSFACIPIKVGVNPEPWGILTVTSDVVGRFDAVSSDTRGAENMPTLRLAAALIALVVAAGTNN